MKTVETFLPKEERQDSVNFANNNKTSSNLAKKNERRAAAKRAGASLPLVDERGVLSLPARALVCFVPTRVDGHAGMVYGHLPEHGGSGQTLGCLPCKDLARGLRACKEALKVLRRTMGPIACEVVSVDELTSRGVADLDGPEGGVTFWEKSATSTP